MKKMITFFFILIISGCCSIMEERHVGFSISELPLATVGKKYDLKIITTGYPVIRFRVDNPEVYKKNGLTITALVDDKMHGVIEVVGVPEKAEVISFNVEGSTPGTQCPGARFEKKFNLKTIE
ncbi:hypothetical protein [Rahnella woolbedingensis]|uniref:Lipoprotein n=1 Tax=Rahnella woolbedingensis TaxID=1510574 RepID=A0A419N1X0_9GAMM|nr:hypothetical protein [Rahnella woolbedingensis]RJT32041.1 hypothetical protein D6C13_24625 [Rahnella woolbedingensis]